MRKFSASAIVALAGSIFLAAPAHEAAATPPAQVSIAGMFARGTGCLGGRNVTASLDSTQSALKIVFGDVLVEVGDSSSLKREFCQVSLNLAVPAGVSYAIVAVDHSGYAKLQSGATAILSNTFYFSGEAGPDVVAQNIINGQFEGTWLFEDDLAPSELDWSPCDNSQALQIKTTVRVNKPASLTGGTNKVDLGSATQTYHLVYRTCR